jgi:hypothetical protein
VELKCADFILPVRGSIVDIAATFGVFGAVTTRLHDVNLATSRPVTVHRVLRHHPDGGPKPVALGKLCNNLDLTVTDALLSLGGQAGRADRRNHGALDRIRADEARRVRVAGARAVTASALVDVEGVVGPHLVGGDVGVLGGKGRNDVKTLGVDIAVSLVGGRPVEGVVTEAIDLDFVSPHVGVECLEVVFVNEAHLRHCQFWWDVQVTALHTSF